MRRIDSVGRRAGSELRLHDALRARPIVSLPNLCSGTGLSFPTASSAMKRLVEFGIAKELTGKRRGRLFLYREYMDILNEGTEPL